VAKVTLTLTDSELRSLAFDLESDRVERKQSWSKDASDKAYQAVCAFANDLPNHGQPGVLLVGVEDDGKPSGLTISDELLQSLGDLRSNGQIVPPPTIVVEKRSLDGHAIAVVFVQPADAPPVRYKGRIWIRTGPRRGLANAQDERILNERRRFRDVPFDIRPLPSCPLNEIDRLVFEEYLRQAFAADVLEANDRSYLERLAACRMIHSLDLSEPTVLGVLSCGKSPRSWLPGAYVQFLRIKGLELTDPIADEAVLDGTLSNTLTRLDDKLKAHLQTTVDFTSADLERRTAAYPLAALQQLARNAVMHRTYEGTHAPVRIFWYEDRIEIQSPGGPFGLVTTQNFGQAGLADYRNPHIAEAMKVLGFVQRFGVGIATAQRELAANGNAPAEFVVNDNYVLVIVRTRP
jgi:ATP-dependent DNA helicase RecG